MIDPLPNGSLVRVGEALEGRVIGWSQHDVLGLCYDVECLRSGQPVRAWFTERLVKPLGDSAESACDS